MKQTAPQPAGNFGFLAEHDPLFAQIAAAAEQAFYSDPNTTLIKLRQLGEALAQHLATLSGITFDEKTKQVDLLYQLNRELQLEPTVRELFHILRMEGNRATHHFRTQHKEAMDGLKVARSLAIWFHRSLGKQGADFKAGPFVPPSDPSAQLRQLQTEIETLKNDLLSASIQLESSQQLQLLLGKEKAEYEALALEMDQEARALAKQAQAHAAELQQRQQDYESRLRTLQAQLTAKNEQQRNQQKQRAARQTRQASQKITLTEELTRILIDQSLNEAGWQADSQTLSWVKGARPEKGVNKAIAEWPTRHNGEKGRADYVLFYGLTPIAVVEAKRQNENVAGKIPQAERYSKGFQVEPPLTAAWELEGRSIAWADDTEGHYHIPFVYSCNGRAYLPQLAEQSGTWFRDVREPGNLRRPLPQFHTPEGLLDLLKRSKQKAEEKLSQEGLSYLRLREYQERAIIAVETTLAQNIRTALLAMATGTGKTRTIIGLIYRFLKTERFKRILFLVDRTALGKQATENFKETTLEQNQSLSQIYNIAELGDMAPQAETRVQVATVQAMVSRVFASDTPPPIDQYDCIIVDEAHRGYTLDQEMTEGELATRDAAQYLSSYRRVLDYFDAVKIALTATPAKHTSDIFGRPVFVYAYREAVADDWLIDYEPPIRYLTQLNQHGIHFEKGSQVSAINIDTGELEIDQLEDDLHFDVDAFNRRVINENFNRVICNELVKELNPFDEGKTLIFCATDKHADMVKRLLDEAFTAIYPDYNQAAVEKITGKSDKVDTLISRYKNERYPNIAITVDLLTTGIDVPKISNLVFMRRVRSRILFEQMIGRATRRCDDIGKTVFRVYDPVDIFEALHDANTMKPLVKNPDITLEQLVRELTDAELLETALASPGEQAGENQADAVLTHLSQKLMRVLRKAEKRAETQPSVRQKLDELEQLWGIAPKNLHQHLHYIGPRQAAEFLRRHSNLTTQLNDVAHLLGSDYRPVISEHHDALLERHQSYGTHSRPEDYLNSFNEFIQTQLNQSVALAVVVNKPRDLTREQLKEIRLLLDNAGYSETNLQTAERNQSSQDIAASIIGHIRRAAIGEPLIPFEQRVDQAMAKIYRLHNWSPVQRNWLQRLAKQLTFEVVLDRPTLNRCFATTGGVKGLDKLLDQHLDEVLNTLGDALWPPKSA
ncbi:type I restriction-modification system endonuclease [Dickeya chrysanthemi]|uniref:type I restriction-modification system endonuclease n=1 Tax=Dickeya chrysanthemi TaxID=556 RepID=UPI003017A751